MKLYSGFEAQAVRNFVWNGAYFGLIGGVKVKSLTCKQQSRHHRSTQAHFPLPAGASKFDELFNKFSVGFVGGSVATMLNTPFDVVKSRMQNQPPGITTIGIPCASLMVMMHRRRSEVQLDLPVRGAHLQGGGGACTVEGAGAASGASGTRRRHHDRGL